MKQKILLFFIVITIYTKLQAQSVEFTFANFPKDALGLLQAQKDLDAGMKLYNQGVYHYKVAVVSLEKANQFNTNNAMLNYEIGMCYISGSFKVKAKPFFEKAFQIDNKVAPDIHYWLGYCHHLDLDFDNARKEYNLHKDYLISQKANANEMKKIDKRLEEIGYGEKYIKKPVHVKIENLGPEINSPYTDYGPIISTDEDVLMFTSRRPGTTAGPEGDKDESIDEYYEDVYQSFSFNNKWTKAKNIGPPVNTDIHDATNNLSPTGEKLFINIDDGGQGDIYECDLVNLQWSKPLKMKDPINTKYHESSATINKTLDTLYFISERPGGTGGKDIYMVTKGADKKWGNLKNAGTVINTEYDEEGVYLMPDSKTLYFSSTGHATMGGYDIFKSTWVNGAWGEPVNIGYPINSADNDVFFVISGNGKHGYYASYKPEGFGDQDIYMVTFLPDEVKKDSVIAIVKGPKIIHGTKTANSTLMKGLVVDSYNQNPIENATIELVDADTKETIEKFTSEELSGNYGVWLPSGKTIIAIVSAPNYTTKTDSIKIAASTVNTELEKNFALVTKTDVTCIMKGTITDATTKQSITATIKIKDNVTNQDIATVTSSVDKGYYEVAVPTGKNYEMVVKAPDYQPAYDYGNIPISKKDQEIVKDFQLNNLQVGTKIILKNIFYDFNKATLRQQSIVELDRLYTLLKDYPNMRIELSSHTDNRGTAEYNIILSNNRSKSCVDYLIAKGIPTSRLEYKGYGLTQPIATNDTDEGRQMNRRTEFKILSK